MGANREEEEEDEEERVEHAGKTVLMYSFGNFHHCCCLTSAIHPGERKELTFSKHAIYAIYFVKQIVCTQWNDNLMSSKNAAKQNAYTAQLLTFRNSIAMVMIWVVMMKIKMAWNAVDLRIDF